MKKRLKEMEDEAAALREMQAKVEKEMSSVQGLFLLFSSLLEICSFCFFVLCGLDGAGGSTDSVRCVIVCDCFCLDLF